MRLTLLAKDPRSGSQGCPSVYVSDTGEFVVQGVELSTAEQGGLQNPLPGETAVRIDADTVLRAVEEYRRGRG
ncbi:hypothetical protein LG943_17070 [Streptomonospora sp. S1-112]|uniref:Uncharacterized protein n=1 Tax=Streptomonospora mangrovi TaxID=2883123 RepID=A0A9X3NM99_9ACTN|nr:hypothetical protein [Streptomonospora mangrovi]MDA0566012.1 hypothetical protein [Streptomonospora mangrovi]